MATASSVAHPPGTLRLCLLGRLELTRADEGALVSVLAQPKRLALLSFLALRADGGFQRRDVLVSLFWPEHDQERARAALRKALYFLRRSLGNGVFITRGDEELGLDPNRIWCDARAFETAVAEDRLEDALDLYRGDLLPGFFIPEASEFEHWMEAERLRLRLQAARVASALSLRAEAVGGIAAAVQHAQAALELDALSEPAFRRLAGLLHDGGDHAGLARAYEVWKRGLEEHFGIEPSEETQRTIAALLTVNGGGEELLRERAGSLVARPVEEPESSRPVRATGYGAPRTGKWTQRGLAWAALLVTIAILLGAAVFVRSASRLNPKRVLVAVFENHTGDPGLDPMGRMVADWIAHGLTQRGNLEIVSPTSGSVTLPEHGTQSIRDVAQEAGAGTVVEGAYFLDGGTLRFQARINDAARGRLLNSVDAVSVSVDSATAGAELLRQRIAGALAARFDWPSEWTEVTRRSQPPTYEAYAEYVMAWDLFSRGEVATAVERMERAWAIDTTFYLSRLYAGLMYSHLSDWARMDSVLQSVASRRELLSPVEQILLKLFESLLAGNHEAAFHAAREFNQIAPGSMPAGYAFLAVATNRPGEAWEVHRRLHLGRGLWIDPEHYWRWVTNALHMLSDHRRELREARRARARQPGLLSGLFREARALAALGHVEEVERLLEESLSLPPQPQPPYPFTPVAVMLHTAVELRAHGHADAAARVLNKAISSHDTGPPEARRALRATLARTLYEAQRWEEARALFEKLSAEQPENIQHLGFLGTLAARRGDRAEAARIYAELGASTRPHLRGRNTLWQARIAAQLGDRERALLLLRQAISQGHPYDLWLHTDRDLDPLRDHRSFRALIRPKG